MMWWCWTVWGAAPEVVIGDDGIHGTVLIAGDIEAVRRAVSDPFWVAKTDGGETTVVEHAREGPCIITNNETKSAIKTVRFRVKRCPTSTGFAETLVSSNTFDTYGVVWTLEPRGEATHVTYDIAFTTSMMVPQFVIDNQTRKSVERLLAKLDEALSK